ncbi:hypothetical protein M758_UG101600, partial [Ceratodon purpureus]
MRVTYWWTGRKGDKKRPISATVIEEINGAIGALVQSVEQGNVYEDLQSLGIYIQWLLDEARYQRKLAIHKDELRRR